MSAVCAGPGRAAESPGMTRLEGSRGRGCGGGGGEEACGQTAGEETGLAVGPVRLPVVPLGRWWTIRALGSGNCSHLLGVAVLWGWLLGPDPVRWG